MLDITQGGQIDMAHHGYCRCLSKKYFCNLAVLKIMITNLQYKITEQLSFEIVQRTTCEEL